MGKCHPTKEAVRILREMAKAQLEMGQTDARAIVDAIYNKIKDFAPMDKVEIADAISGYGHVGEQRTLSDLQERSRQLKKDLRETFHPKTKESIDAAKNEARQKAIKAELADIAEKVKAGNYAPAKRAKANYHNEETLRLQAELERARRRAKEKVAEIAYQKKSPYKRALTSVSRLFRGSILFGLSVFEHLAGASAWRVVSTLFEDAAWAGLRHAPGMRGLDEMALVEGGSHLGSHIAGLKEAASLETLKEMGRKLAKGWTDRELMYGKDKIEPHGKLLLFRKTREEKNLFNYPLVEVIGKSHGAIKVPLERYAYARAMVRTNKNLRRQLARQGKSGEEIDRTMVTDSSLAFQNDLAYAESQAAKLQGKNAVVDAYNNALRQMEESGNIGASLATLARLETPVVKIPMNYIGEGFSYLFGAAKAASKRGAIAERVRLGGGGMTHEEADYIVRNLKKQSVGVGLFAMGFLGAMYGWAKFGGLYRPGKKPLDPELAYGDVKVGEHTLSHHLTHSAFAGIPQLGFMTYAIMREDMEKSYDNKALAGALDGFGQSVLAILFDAPVMPIPKDIERLARGEFHQFFGEKARGFIPAELSRAAARHDTQPWSDKPTKREPETFAQELQMAIPGHGIGPIKGREDVPEAKR